MKIYMKNPKGRLSDSSCLFINCRKRKKESICHKLLLSLQKKVEINLITVILMQYFTYQNIRLR